MFDSMWPPMSENTIGVVRESLLEILPPALRRDRHAIGVAQLGRR